MFINIAIKIFTIHSHWKNKRYYWKKNEIKVLNTNSPFFQDQRFNSDYCPRKLGRCSLSDNPFSVLKYLKNLTYLLHKYKGHFCVSSSFNITFSKNYPFSSSPEDKSFELWFNKSTARIKHISILHMAQFM